VSGAGTAAEIEAYFDRLWPILRSLTGEGVRETHDILSELAPLERIEVPSGTQVFDWVVPQEWVVREAYVVAPDGRRILDVADHTLHLVNGSVGFRGTLPRAELDEHLHSLPEQPEAIPYVTSYYEPRWGFCLSQRERDALPDGDYEVVIDAEHVDGSLTIGEALLPGETEDEVLISTYTCHPSLANNELSGPLVAAFLYRRLAALERRRLTYRFVFVPETIGAIALLARHGERWRERLVAGFVVTCIGDPAPFTLKHSRRGDTLADRAALHVLRARDPELRVHDFFPSGSDERQYCSPGFNLPVASVMRSMYATYPEYHTSLDDRSFVSFDAMAESVDAYAEILGVVDRARRFRNLAPFGEPQLGRRGLYATLGEKGSSASSADIRWVLNFSDGEHDLLAIAERSGRSFDALADAAAVLEEAGLLEEA
jgi:aminopeptidase-like protein